ncbi:MULTISPECIES: hypothetical protein [unclassified Leifsonia]|uniref:hypothetical protein n=1 Tax=unclassified Leifsonia TaxID=2663824 RepID=UPI00070122EB|nr:MULTISPECIES: hypothetical protein [unclassified Leifsonia]KQX07524.1 hypothetical protein ASC59_07215 [Leifsonia sp. Root1293]KRA11806.1 hypothetical protein ASD61_07215 [Leifsonia sp. Root60]
MQFAAQYMAETLHRHESVAAEERLEQRRRADEDGDGSDADRAPIHHHSVWSLLFGHGKGAPARLAHR